MFTQKTYRPGMLLKSDSNTDFFCEISKEKSERAFGQSNSNGCF